MLSKSNKQVSINDLNIISSFDSLPFWQQAEIMKFLEYAIIGYTAHKKTFCARDIVGGSNTAWSFLPILAIYNYWLDNGKSPEEAYDQSGKDLGFILQKTLVLSGLEFRRLDDTEQTVFGATEYERL